jgi:hypothetical protein
MPDWPRKWRCEEATLRRMNAQVPDQKIPQILHGSTSFPTQLHTRNGSALTI